MNDFEKDEFNRRIEELINRSGVTVRELNAEIKRICPDCDKKVTKIKSIGLSTEFEFEQGIDFDLIKEAFANLQKSKSKYKGNGGVFAKKPQ